MKKVSFLLLLVALLGAPGAHAQKVKTKTKGPSAAAATGQSNRWPAEKANA